MYQFSKLTNLTFTRPHVTCLQMDWDDKSDSCKGSPISTVTDCFLFIKGIKNGCPCIVEIRGTQGCALVGDPARAVGECRDVAKAQP